MRKKKLNAEIDYGFSLIGIISALKEYKLAWLLNHHLGTSLEKAEDIEIEFINERKLLISNYLYETATSYFRILKNKSSNILSINPSYILPELNRFDYLLQIYGFEDTFDVQYVKDKLSQIGQIQYVQPFKVDELKSKENLIF